SGAHWAGQVRPRKASRFLLEAIEVLGLAPTGEVDPDENPYAGPGLTTSWPMDPLGSRRAVVTSAAEDVRTAMSATDAPAPTVQLERLLTERAERMRGTAGEAPTRVPASRFKDRVSGFRGTPRDR